MKPSRPREDRLADQVERGLAAERLITDDLVTAWFAAKRAEFTEAMVLARVSDDETRRENAIKIQLLDGLRRHIESEAALGKTAARQQDRVKAHA